MRMPLRIYNIQLWECQLFHPLNFLKLFQGVRRKYCSGLHCPPCCWYDDAGVKIYNDLDPITVTLVFDIANLTCFLIVIPISQQQQQQQILLVSSSATTPCSSRSSSWTACRLLRSLRKLGRSALPSLELTGHQFRLFFKSPYQYLIPENLEDGFNLSNFSL